jgi:hypothetical protein
VKDETIIRQAVVDNMKIRRGGHALCVPEIAPASVGR